MNFLCARLRAPPGRWQSPGLIHWHDQWIEACSVVDATEQALCLCFHDETSPPQSRISLADF